jgi:hypothetical protein
VHHRYNRKTDKLEMSRTLFKYEELSTMGKLFYHILTKFRLAHVNIGAPYPPPLLLLARPVFLRL